MGQTQRSEFSSVIRNNGGSLTALLGEMRRRVRQET
jgi:ABC-type transporter MlaC component